MQIKNIDGLSVSQIRRMVNEGGKFVIFPYTVSIVVMTFKRSSSIYFIPPGENTIKHSYKHVLTNGVLGWWGIPWGPIYTIGSMYHHLSGGKDVTSDVMTHLIQHDPEANTSTYNINGVVSSNTAVPAQQQDTYNIPR
ncbi:hypothetical protein [Flavobacterium psychrotrophum]|uniref:hypothetical protein n=1 Tax=Flavobacterium psychrotrophum TaxID=2294119 RepID=UPI000E30C8FC|nr:hypothetical protein [Flavobacterium psychrotrophum]